jgi:hypothetical protein
MTKHMRIDLMLKESHLLHDKQQRVSPGHYIN